MIGGKILYKTDAYGRPVGHVVVSDLMSDVLLVDNDDILLITSLASDQVLRTAQIVGAMGVVVANGKPLPSTMPEVARSLGIPLATSPLPKYEICTLLHEARKVGKTHA